MKLLLRTSRLVEKSLFEKDYALNRKRPVYYVYSKNANSFLIFLFSRLVSLFLFLLFYILSHYVYLYVFLFLFCFFLSSCLFSIRFPFFLFWISRFFFYCGIIDRFVISSAAFSKKTYDALRRSMASNEWIVADCCPYERH